MSRELSEGVYFRTSIKRSEYMKTPQTHQKSQSMCILLYKHSNFVEAIMLDFDNMYIDENNLIQREQVDHGEYALIFKRKS